MSNVIRLFTVICLLASFVSSAQRGNPATADTLSLSRQFDEMIAVSNSYQRFKVVRVDFLNAFNANVSDSISTYTERISSLENQIDKLEEEMGAREAEIEGRGERIAALEREKDSISLLGLELSKTVYSLIMWGLVIGLLVALLIALGSARVASGNSGELRRQRDKLTEELEASRKDRLTVEQDLRRKLQDEINRRRTER